MWVGGSQAIAQAGRRVWRFCHPGPSRADFRFYWAAPAVFSTVRLDFPTTAPANDVASRAAEAIKARIWKGSTPLPQSMTVGGFPGYRTEAYSNSSHKSTKVWYRATIFITGLAQAAMRQPLISRRGRWFRPDGGVAREATVTPNAPD